MSLEVTFLLEKFTKIQASIDQASSNEERQAAKLEMERFLENRKQYPKEYTITLRSIWQKKLFVALCNKYELRPHRNRGQKYTTIQISISQDVLDELLWPEYLKYSSTLEALIEEALSTVIAKIENGDVNTSDSGVSDKASCPTFS